MLRGRRSNVIIRYERRHFTHPCPSLATEPRRHAFLRRSYSESAPSKKVIFSGIQPTGVPHIGNYLGALKQWVQLQEEAAPEIKLLYSIVDLHAITVRQDAEELRRRRRETLATLLAIGLDPGRSIIFFQSAVRTPRRESRAHANCLKVPAHAELMWILSCTASMGYLSRMTQWKVRVLM